MKAEDGGPDWKRDIWRTLDILSSDPSRETAYWKVVSVKIDTTLPDQHSYGSGTEVVVVRLDENFQAYPSETV